MSTVHDPRRRPVRLAARGLAAALLCAAAAAVPARGLDLAQAYAAALAQDASLRASRAAAEAGREALPQAQARLRPGVSAAAARSKNQLVSTAAGAGGAPATTREGYLAGSLSLTLRQPLYRPMEMANLRQAEARVAESEAALARDLQALGVRVGEAYFELLLADEQIALVQAQKRAFATQLDAAAKAFAAGSGTRTDIDEVRARLDMSTAEELQVQLQRRLAARQLQALVGEPVAAVAPLNVGALVLAEPQPNEIDAWIARAERHSPEIQALQARLDAARHEIDKARAGHRPTLDAVAEWSRNENDNINRIGSRYTSKSLGIQLTVPLYAGGGIDSAVRQAVAEETQARETLQALRDDLAVRVSREFAGVAQGVLRVRALEQAARSADQVVLSNRKSFEAGSRTTVDILDAEQRRVSALRDLAQARFLYLMSQVRLHVLAGVFDAQWLQGINAFFTASAEAAPPQPAEPSRSAATAGPSSTLPSGRSS